MSRSGQSSSTRLRAKDRQAEIIRAAALLFAEKGFNGTKTREISSEAGVSEALIFKHFPSKEDLYAAILAKESPVPQLISQVKDFAQNHNDEAVFRTIAETIVGGAPDDGLMRLILFSALESHELSDMFFQNHIRSFCDVLAGYIQQRIEDGAFREISPILAARAFMGMLIYHRLLTVLFQAPLSQDPREIAETFVTLMMTGVRRSRKRETLHGGRLERRHEKLAPQITGGFHELCGLKNVIWGPGQVSHAPCRPNVFHDVDRAAGFDLLGIDDVVDVRHFECECAGLGDGSQYQSGGRDQAPGGYRRHACPKRAGGGMGRPLV